MDGAARPLGLHPPGLALRGHLAAAPQPRLLPRQLRRCRRLLAHGLAPGAPLRPPRPPRRPRRLVLPLRLPTLRPARRALRPHLHRPRDAARPRRCVRASLLPQHRFAHHLRAARRGRHHPRAPRLPHARGPLP